MPATGCGRCVVDTRLDRRGVIWGLLAVAVTLALVFLGSSGLTWFDAALIGYLFGTLFAIFGVVYRYTVWLQRPPTAVLNRRGWQLLVQDFIFKRSKIRWAFGKLFHIFQRPANLGVAYYKREGASGPQAHCTQCDAPFSSQMQVDDLKQILPHVGFDYSTADGGNYQEICPRCRRRMVALAQSARVGGFG